MFILEWQGFNGGSGANFLFLAELEGNLHRFVTFPACVGGYGFENVGERWAVALAWKFQNESFPTDPLCAINWINWYLVSGRCFFGSTIWYGSAARRWWSEGINSDKSDYCFSLSLRWKSQWWPAVRSQNWQTIEFCHMRNEFVWLSVWVETCNHILNAISMCSRWENFASNLIGVLLIWSYDLVFVAEYQCCVWVGKGWKSTVTINNQTSYYIEPVF